MEGAVKTNKDKFVLEPLTWLGAESPFGIALPEAKPTKTQLYSPRSVYIDDDYLIASDSGNHRVMIWNGVPSEDRQPADVVLGQEDFETEGPNAAGATSERGFHLPTGIRVIGGKLILADAWNHRILIWNKVPESNFQKPDTVIGQVDLNSTEINRGLERPTNTSLYWPYGFNFVNGVFYVADTGNRRVIGWKGIPEPEQPADFVIGQPDFESNLENRGLDQECDKKSFRWVHDIAGNSEHVYFADAGNHRVLGWNGTLNTDRDSEMVLGQEDFKSNGEFPYVTQGPSRYRFPYSISAGEDFLAVADTANNRVLLYDDFPERGCFRPADGVIGQDSFDENGENRWKSVERDSLCWVYGIHVHRDRIAIADSGNNRIMIWKVEK